MKCVKCGRELVRMVPSARCAECEGVTIPPETEDFSAGVAMMSAAMTSPEARETLRLSFFAAALTGSAFPLAGGSKEGAQNVARDALLIANAAIETWYARDKK